MNQLGELASAVATLLTPGSKEETVRLGPQFYTLTRMTFFKAIILYVFRRLSKIFKIDERLYVE